jgi:hypothetical protein
MAGVEGQVNETIKRHRGDVVGCQGQLEDIPAEDERWPVRVLVSRNERIQTLEEPDEYCRRGAWISLDRVGCQMREDAVFGAKVKVGEADIAYVRHKVLLNSTLDSDRVLPPSVERQVG